MSEIKTAPMGLAPGSPPQRALLRQTLLARRRAFATAPEHAAAHAAAVSALSAHLLAVLQQIEPECLGVYWAMRGEFNPLPACRQADWLQTLPWALPFARRGSAAQAPSMSYRAWAEGEPTVVDECGIPSADGPAVSPDVVLVPCVGYTASGLRLGYGGGYFDRYLAAHPGVTAIGLGWSDALIEDAELQPQPHDLPLTLLLNEDGVVG